MERKACSAEGQMLKKSVWLKVWKPRYFRLRGRTLCYYESMQSKVAKGEIPLIGAHVSRAEITEAAKRYTLIVSTKKGDHHVLATDSEEDLERWMKAMNEAIENAPTRKAPVKQGEVPSSTSPSNDTSKRSATLSRDDSNNPGQRSSLVSAGIRDMYAFSDSLAEVPTGSSEEAAKVAAAYVPPPPPPDATDPLSYLMSTSTISPVHQAPLTTPAQTQSTLPPGRKIPNSVAPAHQVGTTKAPNVAPTENCLQPRDGAPSQGTHEATSAPGSNFAVTSSTPLTLGTQLEDQGAKNEDHPGLQLRAAVKRGDTDEVNALLQRDPSLSTFSDRQLMSVLHLAVMFKHETICMALVGAGADPFAENKEGETPMGLAPLSLRKKMKGWLEESETATV
mmetsp:Transcript_8102/g.14356  ORF Transcript_8102/g.14356 Transcript_8102/m.14356 type:complete len:393 (-) Transcript_8102:19-1197(-)